MQSKDADLCLNGVIGKCGGRRAFLGFAPANLLRSVSFAETLDEETGKGYQRPYNRRHSLDFSRYIRHPGASTIPLIFNLRRRRKRGWELDEGERGAACLRIVRGACCLAQVDCQHRLGELGDLSTPLAFMAFIGLSLREEMAMFFVINSKARGLCSSLTDFHQSHLLEDIVREAPHLYIARLLNEEPESPWHKKIRYGGNVTSGLKRRTSLRMMQRAVERFLRQVRDVELGSVEDKYEVVASFWRAVRSVFGQEWENHRTHLLTKGVGLYSLMLLLADIVRQAPSRDLGEEYFASVLRQLKGSIDWSSKGPFAHAGGNKGATEVYAALQRSLGV